MEEPQIQNNDESNKKIKLRKQASIVAILMLLSVGAVFAMNILFAEANYDVTVNEAFSTSTLPVSLSGFPGETIQNNVSISNAANVPLNASISFVQDTNVNGVTYATNMPILVTIAPGSQEVSLTWTINNDSPTGVFNGTVVFQRTA